MQARKAFCFTDVIAHTLDMLRSVNFGLRRILHRTARAATGAAFRRWQQRCSSNSSTRSSSSIDSENRALRAEVVALHSQLAAAKSECWQLKRQLLTASSSSNGGTVNGRSSSSSGSSSRSGVRSVNKLARAAAGVT
jgi:hypothetical protein